VFRPADSQHRTRGLADELIRGGSKQRQLDGAVAVHTHDDEIRADFAGYAKDLDIRLAVRESRRRPAALSRPGRERVEPRHGALFAFAPEVRELPGLLWRQLVE
jgi:hypothetical protein